MERYASSRRKLVDCHQKTYVLTEASQSLWTFYRSRAGHGLKDVRWVQIG